MEVNEIAIKVIYRKQEQVMLLLNKVIMDNNQADR